MTIFARLQSSQCFIFANERSYTMEKIARKHLIDIVRSKRRIITYQTLINEACLDYDLANRDEFNKFCDFLDFISKAEFKRDRPMLTTIVVNEATRKPGKRFYDLYLDLKKKKCTDSKLKEEQRKCREFWQDDTHFLQYKDDFII